MKRIFNSITEILLKLYLLPINQSTKLAMSVRNRIFPQYQHLKGLILTVNNTRKQGDFGKIVIDVGCYDGNTSIFFLKELKGIKVIGFEASTQLYKLAIKNTEKHPEINIENYALSDLCGKTEFYVTENKVSSSLNPITGSDIRFGSVQIEQVNTITLDDYFLKHSKDDEKILAIKLDVQGHELQVLKGAESTLKKTLFVLTELSNHESYKGGAHYYEVDQELRARGFILQNIFASYSYSKYLYEYDAVYINSALI